MDWEALLRCCLLLWGGEVVAVADSVYTVVKGLALIGELVMRVVMVVVVVVSGRLVVEEIRRC